MENKKVLYRKYRPSCFNELVGHSVVKEILTKQLMKKTFSHAMIFSGQRGTGKTSLARLFAKKVLCDSKDYISDESCNKCISCIEFNNESHPDLFEIDAASNNGVDEIRSIKSNISTLPTISNYKIYIIDEVHMLSNAAFNALLKTLEEPPRHALFILATTEQTKIPVTIVSRCQAFNFKKIDQESLVNKLIEISIKEGFEITHEAALEIYYITEGSLRDALNYLEQCMVITEHVIDIKVLKKLFYISSKSEKLEFISNITLNKVDKIINALESFSRIGVDFKVFLIGLIDILKEVVEYKLCKNTDFLNVLNEKEVKEFDDISLETIINLSENLIDAYVKVKNTSLGIEVVLLGIIKSFSNKLISLTNKMSGTTTLKKEENDQDDVTLKHSPKVSNEILVNQDIKEENDFIIEKITNHNQEQINGHKFLLETDYEKKEFQMKSMIKDKNKVKVNVFFSNEDILNELFFANKEKRVSVESKLNDFFSVLDKQNELTDLLIPLYDTKVVASSENCSIIVTDNSSQANWMNNKIRDDSSIEKVFNFLEVKFIFVIDKDQWSFIKKDYIMYKNQNNIPEYVKKSYREYYSKKNTDIDISKENYIRDLKEHFKEFDIEVEE
ncbi:DNA polymerase III subunits gamma and tau [Spiroplasma corruscae]|uniref:DNA polymerase III subunit gamma/tau n=1 Tax=Spiroplasma corruscae TaxID=216934 RepID=A0A222EMZ9_9MOLU|nr:DNA polymerase III subunit gamma/tau [Spiroplasma corruscae]ASP27781.1 DNA polymerase III subunits gamma and tau [Spiroplasma corruscae]